jgi:DNA-binding NarL/FixJ family response regulator
MLDTQLQFATQDPVALVMDPKPVPTHVATLLARYFRVTHCSSLPLTLQAMAVKSPTVMVVSSRFSLTKHIQVLEALKEHSTHTLIPVIVSLDLSQPTITFPGTRWAGKLGFISPDTSQDEFIALIRRLFHT